jgi:ribosomal protein S18 acetylase RimI-like enzyme
VTGFSLVPARDADDLRAVADLFRAYAASLDVDLAYQDFAAELAGLPGRYAPPEGALLLARGADGAALGCVALRPMETPGCCEMKRLFVAQAGRGLGLGRALAEAVITAARAAGYREMRLDSLPSMRAAQALYASLGFAVTPPYYATPVAGTMFMRLGL